MKRPLAVSAAALLVSSELFAQTVELAPSEPAAPAAPVASAAAAPGPAPAAATAPEPSEPVEITVVGTRLARTPGSAHVISRQQLERFEYDDPNAILVQTPGVYLR